MAFLRSPGTQQQWAGTPMVGQLNGKICLTYSPPLEATASEAGLKQIFIDNLQSPLGSAVSVLLYLCHRLYED